MCLHLRCRSKRSRKHWLVLFPALLHARVDLHPDGSLRHHVHEASTACHAHVLHVVSKLRWLRHSPCTSDRNCGGSAIRLYTLRHQACFKACGSRPKPHQAPEAATSPPLATTSASRCRSIDPRRGGRGPCRTVASSFTLHRICDPAVGPRRHAVGPRGADVNKKDITGRLDRSPARPGRTGPDARDALPHGPP